MCLTSLFFNFCVSAHRSCDFESVVLPDDPQAFRLADDLYHVLSRKCQMINDNDSHGTRMSIMDCRACVVRPGCSTKQTLNNGDLLLNWATDYCETRQEPFVAGLQLTLSLQKVLESLPPPTAEFNMCSHSEVPKSFLTSVGTERAVLPEALFGFW